MGNRSNPAGIQLETLRCKAGGHDWQRPVKRGRRPANCPDHKAKAKRNRGSDLHGPHLVGHAKGDSGEQGKFIPLCHGGHMVAPGSSDPAPMRTWPDRREDGTAI